MDERVERHFRALRYSRECLRKRATEREERIQIAWLTLAAGVVIAWAARLILLVI